MLRHFIFSRRNIEASLRVNPVRGKTQMSMGSKEETIDIQNQGL